MKSTCNCEAGRSLGMLFARLPLGLTLAHTGFRKFHEEGVENFVTDNLGKVPAYMPHWFGSAFLHAVPYAEVALGALLVLGLLSRVSGLLATLLLVSFALSVGNMAGFVDVTARMPLANPVVYACFALIVLFAGPGKLSLDALLFPSRKSTPPALPA